VLWTSAIANKAPKACARFTDMTSPRGRMICYDFDLADILACRGNLPLIRLIAGL
jgi:hypothetical protein